MSFCPYIAFPSHAGQLFDQCSSSCLHSWTVMEGSLVCLKAKIAETVLEYFSRASRLDLDGMDGWNGMD